jgi:hypothetical protein
MRNLNMLHPTSFGLGRNVPQKRTRLTPGGFRRRKKSFTGYNKKTGKIVLNCLEYENFHSYRK